MSSEGRLVPAKRPRDPGTLGTAVPCLSNFFTFKVIGTEEITKFAVSFDPELPATEDMLRMKLVRKAASGFKEHIGRYVYANTAVYAVKKSPVDQFTATVSYDNVSYSITLKRVSEIRQNETELRHFYNKFFNSVQGNLSLIMIGRKFFDFTAPIQLNAQYGITLYPGYSTSVQPLENGFMVNIDVAHRVLHTHTVYEEMKAAVSRCRGGNVNAELDKMLNDKIIVTPYNNKIYRVVSVEHTMTPLSSFQKKEQTVTYLDYYKAQYGIAIKDPQQPLLKCKNKKWECYLIPEVCMLTGLTDEQKGDINLRREMINVTKKSPKQRLLKCQELILSMQKSEKTKQVMKDWGIQVSEEPIPVKARVLPGGQIALKGYQFNLTDNCNFDREVQRDMYAQPELKLWGVFYQAEEEQTIQTFMGTLQQVIGTFHIQCGPPALFPIQGGNRWPAWEETMKKNLRPDIAVVICVIPGFKGKSPIYDDLKRFNYSTCPVPTQCVLASTLKKDRGLRSVVNKLITQIVAKTGGCPWVCSQLPFMDGRSMVIGVDVFNKKGVDRVTGFCATTDRELSRYVSFPQIGSAATGSNPFEEVVNDTFASFRHFNNGAYPNKVFVFRDGASEGQKQDLMDNEVTFLRKALNEYVAKNSLPEPVKLMMIVVNKKISARFFQNSSADLANPPSGTIIDNTVTSADAYDFYLVPTKGTQGVITPTHFHVLYDDTGVAPDDIKLLTYRMCYLYYNWSGSIRVPAPCQYAHKLAYAYGERAAGANPPAASQYWKRTRNLYFL